MKNNTNQDSKEKKIWITPEINIIAGLDSCVEFLYGGGGVPKPWPPQEIPPSN